jgi:myo-inositol-1(or 4)-monophosphatase
MLSLENVYPRAESASQAENAPNTASGGEFAELASLIAPLAACVRKVAATELMPRFKRVAAERKHDGSIVTEADRVVEKVLQSELPRLHDCPVLGEEMVPAEQKRIWRDAPWFWCVDPLDGTANFAHGKHFFGVSVALMYQRKSVLGFVLDPNTDEAFHAIQHGGAYLDGRRLKLLPTRGLHDTVLEVGRFKKLGRVATALKTHPPGKRILQSGASVLQWCHMACGRTDAFVHGGESPWDYAAGALILQEAGGRIASLQHDEFWRSNDVDGMWEQSVIAARHPALFDEWKRWVRSHL